MWSWGWNPPRPEGKAWFALGLRSHHDSGGPFAHHPLRDKRLPSSSRLRLTAPPRRAEAMVPLQRGGNRPEIRPRLQGRTAGHGQERDLISGPPDAGSAPRPAGGAWRPSGPLRPGALACQHCPRVSAFPARPVRPPCDSCPAWRRLVTRTHRLMQVSPRKQKATVTGGRCSRRPVGGGEGGPCRLPSPAPAPRGAAGAERPCSSPASGRGGDLEVLPPRLGPQRARGSPPAAAAWAGRCRVTSCKTAPSWASVSLSVGGGCQLAD